MVVHGADFESKPQQDLSLESCPALSAVAKVTVSKELARFRHLFVKCVAQAAGIKCLAKSVCVCVSVCACGRLETCNCTPGTRRPIWNPHGSAHSCSQPRRAREMTLVMPQVVDVTPGSVVVEFLVHPSARAGDTRNVAWP